MRCAEYREAEQRKSMVWTAWIADYPTSSRPAPFHQGFPRIQLGPLREALTGECTLAPGVPRTIARGEDGGRQACRPNRILQRAGGEPFASTEAERYTLRACYGASRTGLRLFSPLVLEIDNCSV